MMGCWSKFGPYLAWILTYVGLLIVPLVNIGYFAYHWKFGNIMDPNDILRTWYMTFALIGVCELIGFFLIGHILVKVVKDMLKAEKEGEIIRLEKLEEDELDDDAGFEYNAESYGEI